MKIARILSLSLSVAALLCACAIHTVEVQQGNIITPETVNQLKPGMTRQQVQFVMGTPAVADPFHPQRWDYVYLLDQPGQPVERRHVTLYFEADKLARVEKEGVPEVSTQPAAAPATPSETPPEAIEPEPAGPGDADD